MITVLFSFVSPARTKVNQTRQNPLPDLSLKYAYYRNIYYHFVDFVPNKIITFHTTVEYIS